MKWYSLKITGLIHQLVGARKKEIKKREITKLYIEI